MSLKEFIFFLHTKRMSNLKQALTGIKPKKLKKKKAKEKRSKEPDLPKKINYNKNLKSKCLLTEDEIYAMQ
jgi:hypothetical protein